MSVSPRKFVLIERLGEGFEVTDYRDCGAVAKEAIYRVVSRTRSEERLGAIEWLRGIIDEVEKEWTDY